MIIKGNQRGGALQLADHLMNMHDNDHVEIHSINGFIANDVHGALQEMYAVSRATRAKQFMFSLSLSPPEDADVSVDDYEQAIEKAVDTIGLKDQPHLILFHEKNGRRHCHVVISRIDTDTMKAINLPFYKERLNNVARDLFLDHGWELPKGFRDKSLSNPLNYTLEEYQIAKRAKRDPREVKATLRQCWESSDSKAAFENALQEKGFYLCKGDKRFIVMDWRNKVYSLSRWAKQKTKVLKERLGDLDSLPSIEDTDAKISDMMKGKQEQFIKEIEADFEKKMKPLETQRQRITENHRQERQLLFSLQKQRREQEAYERSKRFRSGIMGLWDWVSGKKKRITQKNNNEIKAAEHHDRREYQSLLRHQRENQVQLQMKIKGVTALYNRQLCEINEHLIQEKYSTAHYEIKNRRHRRKQDWEPAIE